MASAREVALRTLCAGERQGAWSDGYLKQAIRNAGLDRRDAALATRLCYGVVQNKLRLDWYLAGLSSMPLERLNVYTLCALRLGLYQLQFMDRIPESAAVNEAVSLTRRYVRNPRAAAMVNGILRTYLRRRGELPEPEGGSWAQTMSLRTSHPLWLVEEFAARLGQDGAEQLLRCDNEQPPTTVQANTLRITPRALIDCLEEEGVEAQAHPWVPGCLTLRGTGDIEALAAYRDGLFYVQDGASRCAVSALGAAPGIRLLDCCAAPGGKSFAAALDMGGQGSITACDIYPNKLKLIAAGAQRLGLSCIRTQKQDASQRREEWAGQFDAVITDVPCSGLGIIRKKPDIRYKAPEPLAALPELQRSILENASAYVKSKGVLLYSTCTLLRRENEDVVEGFLASHPEFSLEPFVVPGLGASGGMMTLWPHIHGTDGFFFAKLRKRG